MPAWFTGRPPLWRLTVIALVARLLAAVFSQGYFAHDDHFLVVEAAQSWADGHDYNYWLPWNQGPGATPSGHSFFYVGLHFLLFKLLNGLGLEDPKARMLLVRLLHALWSLAVVRSGYRIALRLSNETVAWRCGLLLALLWFMPFLAVRQLVEVACIPFLLWGAERLIAYEQEPGRGIRTVLVAGVLIGLAVNVRFQTLFFAAGPGLVLLLRRDWRGAFAYGAGTLLPLTLIQGGIDLFLWGRPFAEITEYVRYNLANPTNTGIELGWYKYLLDLLVVFVPPLSVAVFFGYFQGWRRATAAWAGVALFIAVHSWLANKQERFLFPVLPLFLVLGYCAWEQWRARSAYWRLREHGWRHGWRVAWALNLVLLLPLTVSYSKRSRCEALYLLRAQPWATGVVVEDTHAHEPPQLPLFYWGMWDAKLDYVASDTVDVQRLVMHHADGRHPNAVLFTGEEDLAGRVARMEAQVGPLERIGEARPGLIDRIVHALNPVNRNETLVLYRMRRPPQ